MEYTDGGITTEVPPPLNYTRIGLLVTLMSWTMIVVSAPIFLALLFFAAPYGKQAVSNKPPACRNFLSALLSALLGPLNRFTLDPRVGWVMQESPSALIPLLVFVVLVTRPEFNFEPTAFIRSLVVERPHQTLLLALFVAHYVYRAFVYPMRLAPSSTLMPLYLSLLAFSFTTFNGSLQTLSLFFVTPASDCPFYPLCFYGGVLLALTGFYINFTSDNALMRLRQQRATDSKAETVSGSTSSASAAASPGAASAKPHYSIPRGGLFEYVSCANYTGECLEWVGWALAADFALPQVAFALFTLANLVPRALSHHSFYRARFGDRYPAARKAIIPFLL
jgi:3-oxo-5-alpha-steroid 4-dehydrogenase 1